MTDPEQPPAPNRIVLEFDEETFAAICDAANSADLPLDEWALAIIGGEAHFANLPPEEFIQAAFERHIKLASDITATRAFIADNPPLADDRN